MHCPAFQNETLESFALALKKRSKALKFKATKISCERVIEEGKDRKKIEKLELQIHLTYPSHSRISIAMWEDRWFWIDIRRPLKNGWDFEWNDQGRLITNTTLSILSSLEDTIDLVPNMTTGSTQIAQVAVIWRRILAKGPQR